MNTDVRVPSFRPLRVRPCASVPSNRTGQAAARIIGIDPGLSATGYGVVEEGRLLDFGVISTNSKDSVAERLAELSRRMDRVVSRSRPSYCAIESLFFKGGGARSVLLSAEARGVILAVFGRRAIPVQEVTPATVKLAVTGSGRASKQQMNYMIRQLLRLDDRVPEHAADALAAAYCLAGRTDSRLRVTGHKLQVTDCRAGR